METRLKDSNLDTNAQFSIFGNYKKKTFYKAIFLLFWIKVSISAGGKAIAEMKYFILKLYLEFTFVHN